MVIETIKYQCQKCGMVYDSFGGAATCEGMPVPDRKYNVGDEMSFSAEDNLGSRWSYYNDTGIIKAMALNLDGNGEHQWIYFVSTDYSERIVFRNGDELVSPAEQHYQIGFINDVVNDLITKGITCIS